MQRRTLHPADGVAVVHPRLQHRAGALGDRQLVERGRGRSRAATRACGGGVARRREQERRMEGRHDGLGLVSNLHGEERPHPTDDRATRGATG
jgi:hypothetical protein